MRKQRELTGSSRMGMLCSRRGQGDLSSDSCVEQLVGNEAGETEQQRALTPTQGEYSSLGSEE